MPGRPVLVLRSPMDAPVMFGDGSSCLGGGEVLRLGAPRFVGVDGVQQPGPGLFPGAATAAAGSVTYL